MGEYNNYQASNDARTNGDHSKGEKKEEMTTGQLDETAEFNEELIKLKERGIKLKSLEAAVHQEECAYRSELSRCKKRLKGLMVEYKGNQLLEAKSFLQNIESGRPVDMPFLLFAALGPARLVLSDRERLQYKASYERFKVLATVAHLLATLLLLWIQDRPWLDAASNLLLLYSYSTTTLREHILRLNGSAMQIWWIWHHYLCVVLAGCLLVWPAGPTYYSVRGPLLAFMLYIAAVQILQYHYQMSRLYTLRALSRVGPMQTTTDSASVHLSSRLAFLLPLILIGHMGQFWFSIRFLSLAQSVAFREWQLVAIGALFGLIATGNISTTLYTVWQKRRRGNRALARGTRSRLL